MGQFLSARADKNVTARIETALQSTLPAIATLTANHAQLIQRASLLSPAPQHIPFIHAQHALFDSTKFLTRARYHKAAPALHDAEATRLFYATFAAYVQWTRIYEQGEAQFSQSHADSLAITDVILRPLLVTMAKLTREPACTELMLETLKLWTGEMTQKNSTSFFSGLAHGNSSPRQDASISARAIFDLLVHVLWYWTQEGRIVFATEESHVMLVEGAANVLRQLAGKLRVMISPQAEVDADMKVDTTFPDLWYGPIIDSMRLWETPPADPYPVFSPWLTEILKASCTVSADKTTPALTSLTFSYGVVEELVLWLEAMRGLPIHSVVIEDRTLDATQRRDYWTDEDSLKRLRDAATAYNAMFGGVDSTLRRVSLKRCGWALWMTVPKHALDHLEIVDVPEWDIAISSTSTYYDQTIAEFIGVVATCKHVSFDRVPDTLIDWVLPNDVAANTLEFIDEISMPQGEVEVSDPEEVQTVPDTKEDEPPQDIDSEDEPPSPVYLPEEEHDAALEKQYREKTGRTGRLFVRLDALELDAPYRPSTLKHVNLLNCNHITERFLASRNIAAVAVYLTTSHAMQVQELLEQGARFKQIHVLPSTHMLEVNVLQALDKSKWQVSHLEDLVIGHASVNMKDAGAVHARLWEVLTGKKRVAEASTF